MTDEPMRVTDERLSELIEYGEKRCYDCGENVGGLSEVVSALRELRERRSDAPNELDELADALTEQAATIERLTREREQAVEAHKLVRAWLDNAERVNDEREAENERLTARIAALERALRKYGDHTEECTYEKYSARECICGYDAALGSQS